MVTTEADLDGAVYAIVAKQLSVAVGRLRPETSLVVDLGADLVTLTQLALALEAELGIEIVDAEWIEVEYVGQLVEYVRALRERAVASSGRP